MFYQCKFKFYLGGYWLFFLLFFVLKHHLSAMQITHNKKIPLKSETKSQLYKQSELKELGVR